MGFRDGTGPSGKGPMTGHCNGYCILKIDKDKPSDVSGVAGKKGIPIEIIKGKSNVSDLMSKTDNT